jgi:hypothetical protein
MNKLLLYETIKNDLVNAAVSMTPQLEKVANEILTFDLVSSIVFGNISTILLIFIIFQYNLESSKLTDSWQDDGKKIGYLLVSLLLSAIFSVITLASVSDIIKIKTAPTYYLIEKAGNMVKGSCK